MRIVYGESVSKSTKRVPLYKDREAIEAGVLKLIQENNERLRKIKQTINS